MMEMDEEAALRITQQNHKIQKTFLEQHNGHFVKELGDGMLAYFESSADAIHCSTDIQKMVTDQSEVSLRIGLHQAEIIVENGDIYGDGVNIASRIQALAEPGGIYISQAVQNSLPEFETTHLGKAKFKNVRDLIEIYAVQGDGLPEPSIKRFKELAIPRKKFPVLPTIVIFLAMVSLALITMRYLDKRAKMIKAEASLDEVQRLVNDNWRDFTEAYYLAKDAEVFIPDNERLRDLISQTSTQIDISSEPPGAKVFIKPYNRPDYEWRSMGTTPLDSVQVPIGIFRWKLEKEGYEPVLGVDATFDFGNPARWLRSEWFVGRNFHRILDPEDSISLDMVRVTGASKPYGYIQDFFIDKFEVTNEKYKEFIDQGGYDEPDYWIHLRADYDKDWPEVLKTLVDKTGQSGPSTWINQEYPSGLDNYPVTGVSWYEANAYAEFAEKSLPTKDHWGLARGENSNIIAWPQLGGNAIFSPFSNFHGEGPVAVGSKPGITAFGAYDMAGNVREWCWNESPNGRWMRGGGWTDNPYMFTSPSQADPLDRTERNGFRCAKYFNVEAIPEEAFMWSEDNIYFRKKPLPEPVSNPVFETFKTFYEYDPRDLNEEIIFRDANERGWTLEKVAFNAAYGYERVYAYLFLPANAKPPYQTVIYGPGSGVFYQKSSESIEDYYEFPAFLEFYVKSGRAVVFPIIKGSFERGDEWTYTTNFGRNPTHEFTSFITMVIKDYRRCLDYLETREDFDMSKIAFYGMSYGPYLGGLLTAVESRINLNIFYAGGLEPIGRPEVNMTHFLPRIIIPTLLINGKYDSVFPLEKCILSMFNLLGTPENSKRLVLFDSDHLAPREDLVRETLFWLDEHFGQVLYVGDIQRL